MSEKNSSVYQIRDWETVNSQKVQTVKSPCLNTEKEAREYMDKYSSQLSATAKIYQITSLI